MRVIAAIIYILGISMILTGIGVPLVYLILDEPLNSKIIWTGIGGLVMGILFIQGGNEFWKKDR